MDDEEDRKSSADELKNGTIAHQVPASINRYLQDYQRQVSASSVI